jgi:hypothetical protein
MPVIVIALALFTLCILGVCGDVLWRRAKRQKAEELFLQQHPGAAKLYFRSQSKAQTLDVPKANGKPPVYFKESGKQGIYLVPDTKYELNLLCEVPFPGSGGTRKRIYTDVLQITPTEGKLYALEFDHAANCFVLV